MGETTPTPSSARQLFETRLHPLPREQRIELARTVSDERLEALCFDPDPGTVAGVLDNPASGLEHARLVATHHRNPLGLEALGRRPALAQDPQVQRMLLRNPQAGEALLRRLLSTKRLFDLHPFTVSREITERARRLVREALRQAFHRAEADERVRLILTTEGRCLAGLIGLPLGAKAAGLLCAAPLSSSLLVQNLAQWSPTPPNVIEHLLRQPLVQRAPHLRQALLRHPNCPTRLKHGG